MFIFFVDVRLSHLIEVYVCYPGPSIYAGPGFYPKFYGCSKNLTFFFTRLASSSKSGVWQGQ